MIVIVDNFGALAGTASRTDDHNTVNRLRGNSEPAAFYGELPVKVRRTDWLEPGIVENLSRKRGAALSTISLREEQGSAKPHKLGSHGALPCPATNFYRTTGTSVEGDGQRPYWLRLINQHTLTLFDVHAAVNPGSFRESESSAGLHGFFLSILNWLSRSRLPKIGTAVPALAHRVGMLR